MTCPVCGGDALRPVIDIPQVPVFCNQLCHSREQAQGVVRGDIDLRYCKGCGHIFNLAFQPDLVRYSPEYENTLHCSGRFQQYADGLIEQLKARHELARRCVVEVGCGDGRFLRGLCAAAGATGVGFDPSYQGDSGSEAEGVTVHCDVYDPARLPAAPALVCCRHCLEHIAAPLPFLRGLRKQLPAATQVFFEVPNALYTVRDGGIWDILYEHCGYFSEDSLASVFAQAGFSVGEVGDTFAGQFLVLHGKAAAEAAPAGRASDALETMVAGFGALYARKTAELREMLSAARAAGRRVALWGGGTKGVMCLNTVGTGAEVVIDINPKKHGKFVAGTGAPILAPEALRDEPPDLVLVMNHIYQDEIAAALRDMDLHPTLALA